MAYKYQLKQQLHQMVSAMRQELGLLKQRFVGLYKHSVDHIPEGQ